MADQFVAEIRIFPFNFSPTGWATCDGQILPISQNTALFSLLGVNYGGNGTSNFALPNLRDRFALGAGNGPGLTPRTQGDTGGAANVTLTSAHLPAHSHGLTAAATPPTTSSPSGTLPAATADGSAAYRPSGALTPMAAAAISPAGGSTAHENRQPYLALNFCIALQGIFPPRG
jgi:microcystin-dependent protein